MITQTIDPGPLAADDPATHPGGGHARVHQSQRLITLAIVAGPAIVLAIVIPLLWGHAIHLSDVVLAVVLYVLTGFGLTVGYHRLFTHSAFRSNRVLKIVLAVLGSMAVEGSVVSWVATHRRHHMYSDHAGDPHSPHRYGEGLLAQLRGLAFAHIGWLFISDASSAERYAPDMLKDKDLQRVGRLFPVLALLSFAIPFGIGYALTRTLTGALIAMVWAGVVRMALLHHVTWGVNSLCHTFGKRPYETKDKSTDIWALALLSLGDSWHNVHHAHPSWARHGALRGQIDPSAALIRVLERMGLATRVRWPPALGAGGGPTA